MEQEQVILTKFINRFDNPIIQDGYIAVYPNFVASYRRANGAGLPALSPMSLGPVTHSHPGLPPALNLENYWNGSKLFACETDEEGNPLPIWYERRISKWLDSVPTRWKFGKTKAEHLKVSGGVSNAIGAVYWDDALGRERRYPYLEARQFYAGWYERLASQTEEFEGLLDGLQNGVRLQIIGPDAPKAFDCNRSMESYYTDPSNPFGHEMVLASMLMGEHPWRKE